MVCGYREQQKFLVKKLEKGLRLQRDSADTLAVYVQTVDAHPSPLLNFPQC